MENRCTSNLVKVVFTIILIQSLAGGIVQDLQAQYNEPEDAFTPVQISENMLSAVQSERFEVLRKNKMLETPEFVKLPGELHQILSLRFYTNAKKDEIIVSKEGGMIEVTAKRTGVNVFERNMGYSWFGDLYSNGQHTGDITLASDSDGEFSGTIDLNGIFWQIRPLGGEVYALSKMDIEAMKERNKKEKEQYLQEKKDNLKSKDTTSESKSFNIEKPKTNTELDMMRSHCLPYTTRVLVLYTPAAAQGRNISSIVNLAVQETNESYNNSEINNRRIVINHTQQFNFNESGDIEDDLNNFRSDNTVQNLRNQHDADVVLLLTDGDYGSGSGVGMFYNNGDDDHAYSISQVDDTSAPYYTFAHEIGHNQAAQHHPQDPGLVSNPPYSNAYGHRFTTYGWPYRSTVMAYTWSFSDDHLWISVKHFSNPNVNYDGEQTGTSNRNNTTAIIPTFPTISDYRDPDEVNTYMTIHEDPINPYNFTFTAQPCGGTGSYNYEWYLSDSPGFPPSAPPASTQSSWDTFLGSEPGYTTWYVKLLVEEQGGLNRTAESTDNFTVYVPGKTVSAGGDDSSSDLKEKYATELLPAYPNPFNPETTVHFALEQASDVQVAVYDMLGRQVALLVDEHLGVGEHQARFDADLFSSGTYIIRMQAGEASFTQQISLVK